MRPLGQRLDLLLYVQALPVFARNLGVLLPLLVAAAIGIGLEYASGPLFAAVGGAGSGLLSFIGTIIQGFAFAIAVIFADDAWRHNRGSLSAAWNSARRRAGDIVMAVIGFFFLIYVAQILGGIIGGVLHLPYIGEAVGLLALWAFIYSIPATAMGGVPAAAAFSASLQTAKRYPLPTAILTIVSIVVYYGLALIVPAQIGAYLGAGYDVARILLIAFALGYIALVTARQYADFSFRAPW